MGLILALCGSLRSRSVNRLVLQSLKQRLIEIEISEILAELPPFNPDKLPNSPDVVGALTRQIQTANAVLIASPEYIHGVSSVIKTAFDWTVDTGAWSKKPTFVINCSGRATIAHQQLCHTLGVMEAEVIEACVPLMTNQITELELEAGYSSAMQAIADSITNRVG